MNTSDPVNEFAAALAKAQGEFKPVERTRTVKVSLKSGGSYSFDYAPLDAILAATMPSLSKHGISVGWNPETTYADDFAEVSQTCRLTHSSGQWREATVKLRTSETTAQGLGSILTYGRRYSFEHVAACVSESDDDGNAASGNSAEAGERRTEAREPMPACPNCGENKSVIVGKEEYGGGYVCFTKKGGCGEKWQKPADVAAKAESPKTTQKANGKVEADRLAAKHGMTTGDELVPESVYSTALSWIPEASSIAGLAKFADRIKAKRIEQVLDPKQYAELNSLLVERVLVVATTKGDFDAVEKLLHRMHGEMRISEGDYMLLCPRLMAAMDAKLGAEV